jgi:hypothetical protein
MTALAKPSNSYKLQTRPLVSQGAQHKKTQLSDNNKVGSWAPDGCLTQRQTCRLTADPNIALIWDSAVGIMDWLGAGRPNDWSSSPVSGKIVYLLRPD